MVNISRRKFLTENTIGLTGALLLPPTVKYLQLVQPSILETPDEIYDHTPVQEDKSEELDREKILSEIKELRKYAKNAPSREEILEHYEAIKSNGVIENITNSSKRLNVNSKQIAPILCIEQGSPYKGADYGLNWKSPSGCRGIGQLSFGAFFDVVKWYNEQNIEGNYEDSDLGVFLRSYRKYSLEFLTAKKTLTEMMNDESFSAENGIGLNLVKTNSELALLEDKARRYLREDFNTLFLRPEVKFEGKTYDTTAIQIEIVAAYLKKLHEPLGNWDFTVGAYNHGLGTTRALISKYEGKPVSFSSLGEVIEQNALDYRKLFDKKGMIGYFNEFKEKKDLKYMDRNYPLKVQIAGLELKLI